MDQMVKENGWSFQRILDFDHPIIERTARFLFPPPPHPPCIGWDVAVRGEKFVVLVSYPFLLFFPPEITFITATTNGLVDKAAFTSSLGQKKGRIYRGVEFDTPHAATKSPG